MSVQAASTSIWRNFCRGVKSGCVDSPPPLSSALLDVMGVLCSASLFTSDSNEQGEVSNTGWYRNFPAEKKLCWSLCQHAPARKVNWAKWWNLFWHWAALWDAVTYIKSGDSPGESGMVWRYTMHPRVGKHGPGTGICYSTRPYDLSSFVTEIDSHQGWHFTNNIHFYNLTLVYLLQQQCKVSIYMTVQTNR